MSDSFEPTPPDQADRGCMIFIMAFVLALPFIIAGFFLGGAILIMPLLVAFLMAIATPWVNPTEKKSPRAKWIGRGATWLLLVALLTTGYLVWSHAGDDLPVGEEREFRGYDAR
jgi:quinol-cytochrome oxidoreductase complex cytochrome b subunit